MHRFKILLICLATLSTGAYADSYHDKAVKMLELSNSLQPTLDVMSSMMTSMAPSMAQQMHQQFQTEGKNVSLTEVQSLVALYVEKFLNRFDSELVPLTVKLMREHYSERELEDLIVIMETPAFQTYAKKLPAFMGSSSKQGQLLGQKLGAEVLQSLIAQNPKFQ